MLAAFMTFHVIAFFVRTAREIEHVAFLADYSLGLDSDFDFCGILMRLAHWTNVRIALSAEPTAIAGLSSF